MSNLRSHSLAWFQMSSLPSKTTHKNVGGLLGSFAQPRPLPAARLGICKGHELGEGNESLISMFEVITCLWQSPLTFSQEEEDMFRKWLMREQDRGLYVAGHKY